MGLTIEMLGSPGAGKTTMVSAVSEACRDHAMTDYTVEGAAREFAGRTAMGRMVGWLTPPTLRPRALWGVYRLLEAWHTIRFAAENLELSRYLVNSQRGRPASSDAGRRRIVYWYLRTMGSHRFLASRARSNDVLIIDEGFVHRAVQLHASSVESPSQSQISSYVEMLPRPDLVVFVDASVRQCQQRVHDRGVWDRLAHRQPAEVDQFVGNAHHTVSLTRREIGGRGWPVIDVDNGSIDPETAHAALRRELAETFFLSESTAEGRPA